MRKRFPAAHHSCHFWVTNGIKRDEIHSSVSERNGPSWKNILPIWLFGLSLTSDPPNSEVMGVIVMPIFFLGSFMLVSSYQIGHVLERNIQPWNPFPR